MVDLLLKTKLYISPPGVDSIERPHLITLLNEGFNPGKKVIIVSAPLGYGKTTLVSGWLSRTGHNFAWVSLDQGDNDPVRFFTYLIAAFKTVQARIGDAWEGIFQSSILPPAEVLVTMLVNDITAVEFPFILILDDYHIIHNPFIHDVMQQITDHLPLAVHLVLITREDPPLSLPKWRVRDQLTEIRAGDLRFTPYETAAFFSRKTELKLNDEEIAALTNLTEGWVAGLQLAAISLQGRHAKQISNFIEGFNGSHHYITDYLMEELLMQQDSEVRDFLYKTSILDSFCASLCDSVTGRNNSKAMLTKLAQANLFLVAQDDYRTWFRYHHLFAGFLRTQLSETERTELHKRAAKWYETNGYIDYAVKHVLATGDLDEAGSAILRAACITFEKGQMRTLLGWIETLPEQFVFHDDELISYKAYALLFTGRADEAAKCLIRAQNIAADQMSNNSQGRLLAVEAFLAIAREDQKMLELAERAMKLIDVSSPILKIFIYITLGHVQRKTGNLAASTGSFQQALNLAQKAGALGHILGALVELAFNFYFQGKLKEAIDICREAIRTGTGELGQFFPYADIAYIPLGIFYYQLNQLELSRDYLVKGLESIKRLGLARFSARDAESLLARVLYLKGEKKSAFTLIQEVQQDVDQSALPLLVLRYEAQEADLKLQEGDIEGAVRWAERTGLSPDDPVTHSREKLYCIFTRILMARKHYIDARKLLDNLENFAREGERFGSLITVCILQALVRWITDGIKDALPYIEEAVQLASPEGYYRAFLDEGPEVAVLLREVRHLSPVFVAELLKAFDIYKPDKTASLLRQPGVLPEGLNGANLPETLSERELEVLRLIAGGLSNADIARKLHVVVGTVKWHANNIYAKLNVKRRTQAIAQARVLGLVD